MQKKGISELQIKNRKLLKKIIAAGTAMYLVTGGIVSAILTFVEMNPLANDYRKQVQRTTSYITTDENNQLESTESTYVDERMARNWGTLYYCYPTYEVSEGNYEGRIDKYYFEEEAIEYVKYAISENDFSACQEKIGDPKTYFMPYGETQQLEEPLMTAQIYESDKNDYIIVGKSQFDEDTDKAMLFIKTIIWGTAANVFLLRKESSELYKNGQARRLVKKREQKGKKN